MTYSQLANFNNSNGNTEFNGLVNTLKCYGDDTSGVYLIPQIGLAMTFDNGDGKTPPYDDKVAAGLYDYGISQFALALKALNGRPAFVRIGYGASCFLMMLPCAKRALDVAVNVHCGVHRRASMCPGCADMAVDSHVVALCKTIRPTYEQRRMVPGTTTPTRRSSPRGSKSSTPFALTRH